VGGGGKERVVESIVSITLKVLMEKALTLYQADFIA
jgi:hypothetical protein